MLTWLIERGATGLPAELLGLLSGLGWLDRHPPGRVLPAAVVPRRAPAVATMAVVRRGHRVRPRGLVREPGLRRSAAHGLDGDGVDPESPLHRCDRHGDDPRRGVRDRLLRVLRDLGRLVVRAIPGVVRHRAPADQVGRVRLPRCVRRDRGRRPHRAAHGERGGRRARLHGLPRGDRHRRAAVPPLRPRRRDPQDGPVRGARDLRHARLPRDRDRRRRVGRQGQLVPHDARGRRRRGRRSRPSARRLTRFADRLVYGKRATPYEVLSEFSERVGGAYADEDVLAAHGASARRGGRRGTSRRLARREGRAARRRDMATRAGAAWPDRVR